MALPPIVLCMFDKKKKTCQRQKHNNPAEHQVRGAKDKGFGRTHIKESLEFWGKRLSSCKSHLKSLQTVWPMKKKRNVGGDSSTSIISMALTASSDCAEHVCGICPTFFLTYHWRWQGEPTGHAEDHAATPGQGVQYSPSASAGTFGTQICFLDIWVIQKHFLESHFL